MTRVLQGKTYRRKKVQHEKSAPRKKVRHEKSAKKVQRESSATLNKAET